MDSIEEQKHPDTEIVLVVERNLAINEFLSKRKSKFPEKVRLLKDRLGVSNARNTGARAASGDIVAFVDDDAVLDSNWSTELISSFHEHPEVVGVTGRALPLWKGEQPNWFPKSLYWMIGCTAWKESAKPYLTSFVSGVNMAFRKDCFSTHEFMLTILSDPRSRASVYRGLPNDENDFSVRLTTDSGRPILYTPKLTVFHKVDPERLTIGFVSQYSFWQGMAEANYASVSTWKSARLSSYSRLLRTLGVDMLSAQGGFKASGMRIYVLLTAAFFFVGGFISFRLSPLSRRYLASPQRMTSLQAVRARRHSDPGPNL